MSHILLCIVKYAFLAELFKVLSQNLCLQGELILRLSEMCRKMETEEEKVLPFYASSLTKDENEDVEAAVMEAPSQPLAEVKTHNHQLVKKDQRYVLRCDKIFFFLIYLLYF